MAEQIGCMFCDNSAMLQDDRLRGIARHGRPLVCLLCARLWASHQWDELAMRWLRFRPQDWRSDVAAFLEHTRDDMGL